MKVLPLDFLPRPTLTIERGDDARLIISSETFLVALGPTEKRKKSEPQKGREGGKKGRRKKISLNL